jgi:hypothetical protein
MIVTSSAGGIRGRAVARDMAGRETCMSITKETKFHDKRDLPSALGPMRLRVSLV